MSGRDFLAIAEKFRSSPNEAERRTSIGRSYYALYNLVIGTLKDEGVVFHQTGDDHRHLISYLSKVNHPVTGRIGQALNDLRTQRNTADYEMTATVGDRTSELVYEKAKRAVLQFDTIPTADLKSIARKIQAIP